jgi:tRNA A37 threonylcarbamoyladenosine dehydratase
MDLSLKLLTLVITMAEVAEVAVVVQGVVAVGVQVVQAVVRVRVKSITIRFKSHALFYYNYG